MNSNYQLEDDISTGGGGGKKVKKSASLSFKNRLSNLNYLRSLNSNNPQAVMKIASHVRGYRVNNLLNYIGRIHNDKEIELEDENGVMLRGKRDVQDLYKDWSQEFERAKPKAERKPRHVTHLVLSADAELTPQNVKKVHQAAAKACHEYFGVLGFRYVFGLHQDGKKPHVHLAINNYNPDKEVGKLRFGPAEIHVLRSLFAQKLTELGLAHEATLYRDRVKGFEKIHDHKEPLKTRHNAFSYNLNRLPDAEFLKALEASICQLRESVNKSFLKVNEKKYLRASIRRFEKSLLESPGDIQKHISNTFKEFTQYRNVFEKELKALINPARKSKKAPDREKISKIVNLKAYRDIITAKLDIEKMTNDKDRQEALKALNDYSVKLLGKELSHLKSVRSSDVILSDLQENIKAVNERLSMLDERLRDDKEPLTAPERLAVNRQREALSENLVKLIDKRQIEVEGLSDTDKGKNKVLEQVKQMMRQQMLQLQKIKGLGR